MISRYSGIKWDLKTVAKGQTQFINLCAPELDRRLYEAQAAMAAAFLFLYSLLLYCRLCFRLYVKASASFEMAAQC